MHCMGGCVCKCWLGVCMRLVRALFLIPLLGDCVWKRWCVVCALVFASVGWGRARGWCARTLFLISLSGDRACKH